MALRAAGAVQRLPITKARVNLGRLARRAHVNGEYFILEKDGIPVIGIMDADELEDYLEVRDARVRAHIRKSHQDYVAGKSRPIEEFLADLKPESSKSAKSRKARPRHA